MNRYKSYENSEIKSGKNSAALLSGTEHKYVNGKITTHQMSSEIKRCKFLILNKIIKSKTKHV